MASNANIKVRALGVLALVGTLWATGIPPASAAPGDSASNHSAGGDDGAAMAPRISAFGQFGFGGTLDAELETDPDTIIADDDEYDMKATIGFGAQFDLPLHRYFTAGLRPSLLWYDVDRDGDLGRYTILNIDLAPKGRYPLAGGAAEAYVTVPVGPTLNFPHSGREERLDSRFIDVDVNDSDPDFRTKTTVTWNFSVLVGASYMFTPSVGAFLEGGWYNQTVKLVAESESGEPDRTVEESGAFSQFGLVGGVTLSF